jgi:hypothetical protein
MFASTIAGTRSRRRLPRVVKLGRCSLRVFDSLPPRVLARTLSSLLGLLAYLFRPHHVVHGHVAKTFAPLILLTKMPTDICTELFFLTPSLSYVSV